MDSLDVAMVIFVWVVWIGACAVVVVNTASNSPTCPKCKSARFVETGGPYAGWKCRRCKTWFNPY